MVLRASCWKPARASHRSAMEELRARRLWLVRGGGAEQQPVRPTSNSID
jgi:hypothetical protein